MNLVLTVLSTSATKYQWKFVYRLIFGGPIFRLVSSSVIEV